MFRYQTVYKRELTALLAGRANHPSIIQFDLFNEGQGVSFGGHCPLPYPSNTSQATTDAWLSEVTMLTRAIGGGRLVDTCSGCNSDGYGDVTDEHRYAHSGWELQIPLYNTTANRPSYVGELGGFLMVLNGHDWEPPHSKRADGTVTGNESMCVATSHWAGYPVYEDNGSGDMTTVAVGIFDALSGRNLINGVEPPPYVSHPTPPHCMPLCGCCRLNQHSCPETHSTSELQPLPSCVGVAASNPALV